MKKFLLIAMPLAILGVLAVLYLYKPVSTPVVSEPVPVPTPTPVPSLALRIIPGEIEQGEPVLIAVEGAISTSSVASFTFNNIPLVMFIYEGKVSALLGIDLSTRAGVFPLVLRLKDGRRVEESLVVRERPLVQKPFGIPEKLGGNTPQAEQELLKTLAQESKIMSAIPTTPEKLWSEAFGPPLAGPLVVSDTFGHTRITGNSTLRHKGVDLQASIGTPVYAMNRGVARYVGYLRNYGNVVVIDHGLGLHTVYMHLSEISVVSGEMVEKGELLGKSGDTGYVLDPHLHLSVRIWDISVDPLKFLELLGSED